MIKQLALVIALGVMGIYNSSGQGYYDDDIYYNASKAKKEKQEATQKAAEKVAAANYVPNQSVDFPAADTYTIDGGSTRDVDEYNRRTKVSGPSQNVMLNDDATFANTRQIEKFHNPTIVENSGDETLQYLYYANEAQRAQKDDVTQVNIYVNSSWGWNGWNSWNSWWPYYSYGWGPSWGWNNWYWNSWYGPSWSWSWGGPGWGWSFGWTPSWGWGGPSWGWGGPAWNAPVGGRPGRPGGSWNPPAAPGRGNFVRHNQLPAGQVSPGTPGNNRHNGFNAATSRHNTILSNTRNNNSRYTGVGTGTRRTTNIGTGSTPSRNNTIRNTTTNRNTGTINNSGSTSRHTGGSSGGGSRNTGGGGRGRH